MRFPLEEKSGTKMMPLQPPTSEHEQFPGKLLSRASLERAPERVAPLLLGKLLVRKVKGLRPLLVGRIVEVEAYLGPHNATPDPAAHAHRGPMPRNAVLFGPAGHAYVYSIYGKYFCMNISCEAQGQAGCVLLRALEPLAGFEVMARNRGLDSDAKPHMLTSGPSRLCQALGLTRAEHNGLDLLAAKSPLQVRDDGFAATQCLATSRIGIRHAVDLPLRFHLEAHRCVSGPRRLSARRVFIG